MRKTLVLIGAILLTTAAAQQHDEPLPKGTIYGVVIGQDGLPAKRIGLTASPLGVPLATKLPHTKTNDADILCTLRMKKRDIQSLATALQAIAAHKKSRLR